MAQNAAPCLLKDTAVFWHFMLDHDVDPSSGRGGCQQQLALASRDVQRLSAPIAPWLWLIPECLQENLKLETLQKHNSDSAGQKRWAMCCILEKDANLHRLTTALSTARLACTLDWHRWQTVSALRPIPALHTRRQRTDSEYAECSSSGSLIFLPMYCYAGKLKLRNTAEPISYC